jgi:hypothetical protein
MEDTVEDKQIDAESSQGPRAKRAQVKRSDIYVKFVDAMGADLFREKRPKLIESNIVTVNTAGSMYVGKEYSGKSVRVIICETDEFERTVG